MATGLRLFAKQAPTDPECSRLIEAVKELERVTEVALGAAEGFVSHELCDIGSNAHLSRKFREILEPLDALRAMVVAVGRRQLVALALREFAPSLPLSLDSGWSRQLLVFLRACGEGILDKKDTLRTCLREASARARKGSKFRGKRRGSCLADENPPSTPVIPAGGVDANPWRPQAVDPESADLAETYCILSLPPEERTVGMKVKPPRTPCCLNHGPVASARLVWWRIFTTPA